MNRAAYTRVLEHAHSVRILARQLVVVEIDEAIAAIQKADAAGPILDATLYRDRQHLMAQDETTLRAVRELALLGGRVENLAGGGVASEPACPEHDAGSRGTRVSSPAEHPVAFPGIADGVRNRPAAS